MTDLEKTFVQIYKESRWEQLTHAFVNLDRTITGVEALEIASSFLGGHRVQCGRGSQRHDGYRQTIRLLEQGTKRSEAVRLLIDLHGYSPQWANELVARVFDVKHQHVTKIVKAK